MTDSTRPISRRVRFEILRRDGHACRYCGATSPDVPLTVDHVIPRALGGSDDPSNLVTACRDCNYGKGSTSPDEHIVAEVDAASLLFAKAMERAAEMRREHRDEMESVLAAFDKAWGDWYSGPADDRSPIPRDRGWRESVAKFVELGLDLPDLQRFILVAMNGNAVNPDKWKYFCGCCWHEITDRQEIARRLIEDGKV